MDHYAIWFNLKDTRHDLEFCDRLNEFLGRLTAQGVIAGHRLVRRKLGFGPPELGEFHLDIEIQDLTQLERAFAAISPRTGPMEDAHTGVFTMVKDFRSGLYRDWPDPARVRAGGTGAQVAPIDAPRAEETI